MSAVGGWSRFGLILLRVDRVGIGTCSLYKASKSIFELAHTLVYIGIVTTRRGAGGSNTSLYALATWSFAIALVLATMTLCAAVPDTLASFTLIQKLERFRLD